MYLRCTYSVLLSKLKLSSILLKLKLRKLFLFNRFLFYLDIVLAGAFVMRSIKEAELSVFCYILDILYTEACTCLWSQVWFRFQVCVWHCPDAHVNRDPLGWPLGLHRGQYGMGWILANFESTRNFWWCRHALQSIICSRVFGSLSKLEERHEARAAIEQFLL